MDSHTIILGDFNTPLTPMDRSLKQKFNKETQVLHDTFDEMDLIDIFRTFHSNAENTPSSQVHMEQPLGNITQCHKQKVSANLRKQIISSIFSNHNAMRLEINYKKKL